MTITFIPGEVNNNENTILQANWKTHHLVIYGSGNNLIISGATITKKNKKPTPHNIDRILQTIYLQQDPSAIEFYEDQGIIIVGISNKIVIYKPVDEYMKFPKWTIDTEFEVDSKLQLLKLAHEESEVIISTGEKLILYHLYNEYGKWKLKRRWSFDCIVDSLSITPNGGMILTCCKFDRLLKVWQRISSGDNTLFEIAYLNHDRYSFIRKYHHRLKQEQVVKNDIDSLANIPKIRGFINSSNGNSDVIYSLSSDGKFRVWASYEFSGHNHISNWATLELGNIATFVIIENMYIKEDFNLSDFDLLFAIDKDGNYRLFAICNISQYPPNNIKFVELGQYEFGEYEWPRHEDEKLSYKDITSDDFMTRINPVMISKLAPLNNDSRIKQLSILIHDRLKNTIRFEYINPDSIRSGFKLILKFQGHTKSIRKLVKSNSLFTNSNILLSISNFAENNYIWEPMTLPTGLSITRKCKLNLTSKCLNSVILNDIEPPKKIRRHLIVTYEENRSLNLWDCKEHAKLVKTIKLQTDQHPKVFFLIESPINKIYCVIAIYDDFVLSWKLSLTNGLDFVQQNIENLPKFLQISAVDVFINQSNRTLVASIDNSGLLTTYKLHFDDLSWVKTHEISTNISNSSHINGSIIIGKIAIVDESGYKLSIWDIKQKVLEYEQTFSDRIKDLDWTFINPTKTASNAILSVGFDKYVLLYTQLRYDYTNNVTTYANIKRIDISEFTSHSIGDSIWLDDGLIIGSGNQFFIDDKWIKLGSNIIDSTIRQLLTGFNNDNDVIDIKSLVCILNGPLPIYHPQFLIQALYMNQVEYCETILVTLFQHLRTDEFVTWDLGMNEVKQSSQSVLDVFTSFDANLADLLIEKVMKISLPLLTRHQQSTLISIIIVMKDLQKQIKSLDLNGYRFMIGFKLFQLSKKQKQLNMRDINWALHSDNKELLISEIYNYYKHKLLWENVKQTGMAYWVNARLTNLIEDVARNEFAQSRDPQGLVSLLYLALGKKQILIGLWKTCVNQEKTKMIKFLSNDFSQSRWKSAALKNAFVLLGKHRYIDAAYFFLLGDSPWDCCSTLASKCNDILLAIAIAKLHDGQVLRKVIEKYVTPIAIDNGDKWITSWIYWQLNEKEISIQALIKTPGEIFNKPMSIKSHSFLQDDPVLILLFNDLRSKKLNYLKGSLAVSKQEEFKFIIKVCMIYTRMGCDYLAMLLVKNWEFSKDVKKEEEQFETYTQPPPVQVFEEPDMSAFDFGF